MRSMRRILLLPLPLAALGLVTFALHGCGSTAAEVVLSETDEDGGGGVFGADDSGAADTSPNPSPSPCTDTSTDPNNCGQCGNACPPGNVCAGGKCTCPAYTSRCGGACIETVSDPKNCGGCGVECTGNLVCSGGTCASSCVAPLVACSNACVDTLSDNRHCGACGAPCAAGTGCVDGTCQQTIAVGPAPAKCVGGGPAVSNPQAPSGCLGDLAQTLFRWAICSCEDATFGEAYTTDGFDSTKGPYTAGGLGAGVGVNGAYGAAATADVGGALFTAGPGGISPAQAHAIKQQLSMNGGLEPSGTFGVGANAFVSGDVGGGTPITIAATLTTPAGTTVEPNVTYGALVRQPVNVAPPCDFCAPADRIPIAAIVGAHRGSNNDNASIGLPATALSNPSGPRRLELPCGSYYLTEVKSNHDVTIVAKGRTALYVDGDIEPLALGIAIDPGAELDVFVMGDVRAAQGMRLGSPHYPARLRLYIAGASGFSTSVPNAVLALNMYVLDGTVQFSDETVLFGSIYVASLDTNKKLDVHYDRAILGAGEACAPPASGDGGTGGGGGPGPGQPGCGTCKDCGNQACINGSCGECTSSAQCCPPLVCVQGGCVSAVN